MWAAACWRWWTGGGRRKCLIANWPRVKISSARQGMECARGSAAADCPPRSGCWEEVVAPALEYSIVVDIEADNVQAKRNPGCRTPGCRSQRGSSKEPRKTEVQRRAGREWRRSVTRE